MDETANVDGRLLAPDAWRRAGRASSGTRCLTTGPGTGEQDMTDDNIVAQDTLSLNPSSGERNASPDEGRSYEVSS
jgi:hypothetical protein